MLKCPNCESKLEELTEITGYHYWMCGNSDCKLSYKFYRKAAQHRVRADALESCDNNYHYIKGDDPTICSCGKPVRR